MNKFHMRNTNGQVNSKSKAWIVSVAAFLLVYTGVCILQAERSNFKKLVAIANMASGPPTGMAAMAEQIARRTKDADIRFVAEYFQTIALTLANSGFTDLSATRQGGAWDAFITGGLNMLVRPEVSLKALGQGVWLWTNESRFKSAAQNIENRYGGLNFRAIFTALLAATAAKTAYSRYRAKAV